MEPQCYDYGDEVRVIRNVRNDGTYPGLDVGAFLVRRGSVGYVVNVGTFLQDQVIYSVHFLEEQKVVGCREEELIRADEPWRPSRFEFRDKVDQPAQFGGAGRDRRSARHRRRSPQGLAGSRRGAGALPRPFPRQNLTGAGSFAHAGEGCCRPAGVRNMIIPRVISFPLSALPRVTAMLLS